MSQNIENTQFRSLRSPGHLQLRRVRCGKRNCKCARGFYHTAYYHAWDEDAIRHRQYVRRAEVEWIKEMCDQHRALKTQWRALRDDYRLLNHVRELKKILAPLEKTKKA